MAATKPKADEKLNEIATVLREFLGCWQAEPGRAKQLAEDLETLLPQAE